MLRQWVAVAPVRPSSLIGDRGRRERPGGAGHVPARVVVLGIQRITRAGGELVTEGVRRQQVDTPRLPRNSASAVPAAYSGVVGMQDRRHVCVVEIQCMTSDSVYQCGVGHAQPVRVPSDRGLRAHRQAGEHCCPGDPRCGLLRRPRWRDRGGRAGSGCSRAVPRRARRGRRCAITKSSRVRVSTEVRSS